MTMCINDAVNTIVCLKLLLCPSLPLSLVAQLKPLSYASPHHLEQPHNSHGAATQRDTLCDKIDMTLLMCIKKYLLSIQNGFRIILQIQLPSSILN